MRVYVRPLLKLIPSPSNVVVSISLYVAISYVCVYIEEAGKKINNIDLESSFLCMCAENQFLPHFHAEDSDLKMCKRNFFEIYDGKTHHYKSSKIESIYF